MYAPILITVLNRYDHFRRCVESISNCTSADKTDLFIALDYPSKEEHWIGYNRITEYIDYIKGFKSVNVIRRNFNYGAEANTFRAFEELFKTYETLIITEDDNEFSKNFLIYINKGLTIYKNSKSIFGVCGYNYPINLPASYKSNVYIWKGFSGWGFGIWRDKWNAISLKTSEITAFLSNPKNGKLLNQYAGNYMPALLEIINTDHMTADTFISMYLIKNNMYCIFPSVSKVRNHGHDGSGIHGGVLESNIYLNQLIDKGYLFNFYLEHNKLEENKDINLVLKKHFAVNKLRKLFTYGMYIKFLVTFYTKSKLGFTRRNDNANEK